MTDEKLDRDDRTPPLSIEEGAILGLAEEEDLVARQQALRSQLAETLRAVLAERLVRAPTEEFEAVQLSGKEKIRAKRAAEENKPQPRELDVESVRQARTRLDQGGVSSRNRPDTGRRGS